MALGEMNSGNEKLPEWSEVQNKPPEFNPSKHFHNFIVDDGDNRDSNTAPSDYYGDKDNDDCHGKMIFRGIKKLQLSICLLVETDIVFYLACVVGKIIREDILTKQLFVIETFITALVRMIVGAIGHRLLQLKGGTNYGFRKYEYWC